MAATVRAGGRPPLIAVSDIVAAGREIGMRGLSVHAVAASLKVSPTALYRHIKGRWELERLVGESLLAGLRLDDDAAHDVETHLLSFGLQLLAYTDVHPGLATYLQVLFPRGDAGARLLATEVDALARRGYSTDSAMVLSSSVATIAISLAAREETNTFATGHDTPGFDAEKEAVESLLAADDRLGQAHLALPKITSAQYVRMLLTASIRGLLAAIPAGREVDDVIRELTAPAGTRTRKDT